LIFSNLSLGLLTVSLSILFTHTIRFLIPKIKEAIVLFLIEPSFEMFFSNTSGVKSNKSRAESAWEIPMAVFLKKEASPGVSMTVM
jgi:hypothetical protein